MNQIIVIRIHVKSYHFVPVIFNEAIKCILSLIDLLLKWSLRITCLLYRFNEQLCWINLAWVLKLLLFFNNNTNSTDYERMRVMCNSHYYSWSSHSLVNENCVLPLFRKKRNVVTIVFMTSFTSLYGYIMLPFYHK